MKIFVYIFLALFLAAAILAACQPRLASACIPPSRPITPTPGKTEPVHHPVQTLLPPAEMPRVEPTVVTIHPVQTLLPPAETPRVEPMQPVKTILPPPPAHPRCRGGVSGEL